VQHRCTVERHSLHVNSLYLTIREREEERLSRPVGAREWLTFDGNGIAPQREADSEVQCGVLGVTNIPDQDVTLAICRRRCRLMAVKKGVLTNGRD
jgi:hypothetical protein